MKPNFPTGVVIITIVIGLFFYHFCTTSWTQYQVLQLAVQQAEAQTDAAKAEEQRAELKLSQVTTQLNSQRENSKKWATYSDRYDYDDMPPALQQVLLQKTGIRGNTRIDTKQEIAYNWHKVNMRLLEFEVTNSLPGLLNAIGEMETHWEAMGIENMVLEQKGTTIKLSLDLAHPLQEPIYVAR
jgi:hypothetical protein